MELPFTLAKWDSKMPRRKRSSKRILIVDDEPGRDYVRAARLRYQKMKKPA